MTKSVYDTTDCGHDNSFSPSTSIADAWLVVEKIKEMNPHFVHTRFSLQWLEETAERPAQWAVGWMEYEDLVVSAREATAPLAICLAALKAVGVDLPS